MITKSNVLSATSSTFARCCSNDMMIYAGIENSEIVLHGYSGETLLKQQDVGWGQRSYTGVDSDRACVLS